LLNCVLFNERVIYNKRL